MKARVKLWHPGLLDSPWLTRSEAAYYLRWNVKTLDRNLIAMTSERIAGKMRFELQVTGTVKKVRVLAQDVYAICPLPPDYPIHASDDQILHLTV